MRRRCAIAGTMLGIAVLAGTALAQPANKPPVPKGIDPGGVAVAVIGPGVNYTNPGIAARLARDGEGELIGWDFIDDDARPYKPASFAEGSRIGLAKLPEHQRWRLIPVRANPADEASLARAVSFVAATPARLVAVAMWGGPPKSWEHFRQVAEQHKRILFVVHLVRANGVPDPGSLLALDNVMIAEVPLDGTFEELQLHAGGFQQFLRCQTSQLPPGDGAMLRRLFTEWAAGDADPAGRDCRP